MEILENVLGCRKLTDSAELHKETTHSDAGNIFLDVLASNQQLMLAYIALINVTFEGMAASMRAAVAMHHEIDFLGPMERHGQPNVL